jgi:hypothetical protein
MTHCFDKFRRVMAAITAAIDFLVTVINAVVIAGRCESLRARR